MRHTVFVLGEIERFGGGMAKLEDEGKVWLERWFGRKLEDPISLPAF